MMPSARLAAYRCPVCGEPGRTCGPRGDAHATATIAEEGAAMAELREYNVTINNVETTMMLNEKEAERLKARPVDAAARQATAKARSAHNKARRTPAAGDEE